MDTRIRILLRIIEERGGKLQMTSKQVGSLLGLGEARVLRLFSSEVGKTLSRHLLEVRMQRAAGLLRQDFAPIKKIAFDCGYTKDSNFHRDFRRVFGTSPKQMRLRWMNIRLHDKRPAIVERPFYGNTEVADVDQACTLHLVAPNRHTGT